MDPAVRAAALAQFKEDDGCWHCRVLKPYIEHLEQHRDDVIEALLEGHDEQHLWRLSEANRDIALAEMPVPTPWMC
jgi:hypothetical protein